MNRLQFELRRLYAPGVEVPGDDSASPSPLVDPNGRVRALVMELRGPASWEVLGRVWHGVQAELGLPAPAIAVSGSEGLQLWFSVAEAMPVPEAYAFLQALRERFLPEVDDRRIALWPALAASSSRQDLHARPVPALQEASGNWSAFVAPDLAAVFAETPWLDIAPGDEGQVALLRALAVMKQPDFEAASGRLTPAAPAAPASIDSAAARVSTAGSSPVSTGDATNREASATPSAALPSFEDPRRFLLHVMNDDSAPLALRIEAAKALLQSQSR